MIAIDKFLTSDLLFAVGSALLMQFIYSGVDVDMIANRDQKDIIDYMVAVVLTLVLARFFTLFLVVSDISKML